MFVLKLVTLGSDGTYINEYIDIKLQEVTCIDSERQAVLKLIYSTHVKTPNSRVTQRNYIWNMVNKQKIYQVTTPIEKKSELI